MRVTFQARKQASPWQANRLGILVGGCGGEKRAQGPAGSQASRAGPGGFLCSHKQREARTYVNPGER